MTYQFQHQWSDSKKIRTFNVRVEEGFSRVHAENRHYVFIDDIARVQVCPENSEGKTEREIAEYAFNRWVSKIEFIKAKYRG